MLYMCCFPVLKFVANFRGLFLTEFVLFFNLAFPCCSVWLREVKVIVLQQSCCMFMHACF